jgi:hypothetical protein
MTLINTLMEKVAHRLTFAQNKKDG